MSTETQTRCATLPFERWETVRYELLNSRICDLGLRIAGSPIETLTARLLRELEGRGLTLRPRFYLTDTWGCPNKVPVIGIPFYLADRRLCRIEEEQTGEVEDEATVMMYLRHEAGHAVNYAWRLWKEPGWTETFGHFSRPYPESFAPQTASREFVRHIFSVPHGHTYAQKHPDEDFAETFAVWLTPRSGWRRRYRTWPAFRKLLYVDKTMRRLRGHAPGLRTGRLLRPVERMTTLLAKHYGERAERFRTAAEGYVDDKLREVFPTPAGKAGRPAAALLAKHRVALRDRIVRWSGLDNAEAEAILTKVEDRARALQCAYARSQAAEKLMDISALATALAMEFAYTGRLLP